MGSSDSGVSLEEELGPVVSSSFSGSELRYSPCTQKLLKRKMYLLGIHPEPFYRSQSDFYEDRS